MKSKTTVAKLQKVYDYIKVTRFDLAILIYNYLRHHEKYGNMDAVRSYDAVKKRLRKKDWYELPAVEALLYCANMLNEDGEFWHPEKITFDDWVKRAFGRTDFDKIYNYFKEAENDC